MLSNVKKFGFFQFFKIFQTLRLFEYVCRRMVVDGGGAAVLFGRKENLLMAKISVDIFARSFSSFLWIQDGTLDWVSDRQKGLSCDVAGVECACVQRISDIAEVTWCPINQIIGLISDNPEFCTILDIDKRKKVTKPDHPKQYWIIQKFKKCVQNDSFSTFSQKWLS